MQCNIKGMAGLPQLPRDTQNRAEAILLTICLLVLLMSQMTVQLFLCYCQTILIHNMHVFFISNDKTQYWAVHMQEALGHII